MSTAAIFPPIDNSAQIRQANALLSYVEDPIKESRKTYKTPITCLGLFAHVSDAALTSEINTHIRNAGPLTDYFFIRWYPAQSIHKSRHVETYDLRNRN